MMLLKIHAERSRKKEGKFYNMQFKTHKLFKAKRNLQRHLIYTFYSVKKLDETQWLHARSFGILLT